MDNVISSGGEVSSVSGLVVDTDKNSVTLRVGRPYLISPGTMLQVTNGSLVNRGDMIATLVFERQKTGDIVQGLPRVEELLEGRKPKDCAILAEYDGVAEIEIEDEVIVKEAESMYEDYMHHMSHHGITEETYLQYLNTTKEQIIEFYLNNHALPLDLFAFSLST